MVVELPLRSIGITLRYGGLQMQVNWFFSFTEAAKWKSLSKAAEKLSLTQPAISKHIRQLEAAYGVELFRRSATGVELTDAGRYFLKRIRSVVLSLEKLEVEMRQYSARLSYTLGSLENLATQVLPKRLRGYQDFDHSIKVRVRQSSDELREELQEGTVDAALMDASYVSGRMWSRVLFNEGYIAVLPEDHPLRGRHTLSPIELKDESFVLNTQFDTYTRFLGVAEKYGYCPDIELEVDNNDFLLDLVAEGTGITVLPELFKQQAKRRGLYTIPIAEPELRRTIVLAARTPDIGSKF